MMPSLTGNVYMPAIIDFASRRVWCYFIRTKDEAFSIIKHFFQIELIRVRAANRINILVSDGGELHSNNSSSLWAKYNVLQKFTSYNTPENNSIVEKM